MIGLRVKEEAFLHLTDCPNKSCKICESKTDAFENQVSENDLYCQGF